MMRILLALGLLLAAAAPGLAQSSGDGAEIAPPASTNEILPRARSIRRLLENHDNQTDRRDMFRNRDRYRRGDDGPDRRDDWADDGDRDYDRDGDWDRWDDERWSDRDDWRHGRRDDRDRWDRRDPRWRREPPEPQGGWNWREDRRHLGPGPWWSPNEPPGGFADGYDYRRDGRTAR
ncbi:hypothetical protein [Consotaella aegiceratis]|uniref:hypothetical protein n=1 Tax=Consotaella aegiceratis TaxID=3097961 RepID=UPI002F40827E